MHPKYFKEILGKRFINNFTKGNRLSFEKIEDELW